MAPVLGRTALSAGSRPRALARGILVPMLPLSVAGRRLLLLALVVTTALLVAAPAAHAKSYSLPRANLAVRVNTDGTVDVAEEITFDFDGEFHGAWRDIPFRFGERIPLESISVGEGDRSYGSGGDTRLGTAGPSNTFASAHDAEACASCGATTPPTSSAPFGWPTASSGWSGPSTTWPS